MPCICTKRRKDRYTGVEGQQRKKRDSCGVVSAHCRNLRRKELRTMKRSQKYYLAMIAVINSEEIAVNEKLEIIETLIGDKTVAEYSEKMEEEK
jgi:hypothetical protein